MILKINIDIFLYILKRLALILEMTSVLCEVKLNFNM
jgi:hypothetical protein